MRFLLDTHAWLWWIAEPSRLGTRARDAIADADSVPLLSAASAWEVAIKWRLGKLRLAEPPATFVPPRLERDRILSLGVGLEHALRVAELPDHHRDPFDRLLVAQAQVEGVPLLTSDPLLEPYAIDRIPADR